MCGRCACGLACAACACGAAGCAGPSSDALLSAHGHKKQHKAFTTEFTRNVISRRRPHASRPRLSRRWTIYER